MANASMDIPEPMIESQVEGLVQDYARRMYSQGIAFGQYMEYTGMTKDSLKEQMRPQAVKRIETRLVLEAVAEAEKLEVTDERLEEEIQKMAEAYKMEAEKLKEHMGDAEKKQMKQDIAVQEAVDFLVAEAQLV